MKIIFIILLTNIALALQFSLVNKQEGIKNIQVGEYFIAQMEIYPKQELGELEKLRNFLNERDLGLFTIIDISNLRASENNSDVIVADLGLVLRDNPKEFLSFKIGEEVYPITLKGFEIDKSIKPKAHILEQEVSALSKLSAWYLVGFLIFGAVAYVGLLFYKKKQKEQLAKKQRDEALKLLKEVSDRNSYEVLYRKKDVWLKYVDKKSAERYFSVLNKHQYKPEWNEQILNEVKSNFEQIEVLKDV